MLFVVRLKLSAEAVGTIARTASATIAKIETLKLFFPTQIPLISPD